MKMNIIMARLSEVNGQALKRLIDGIHISLPTGGSTWDFPFSVFQDFPQPVLNVRQQLLLLPQHL